MKPVSVARGTEHAAPGEQQRIPADAGSRGKQPTPTRAAPPEVKTSAGSPSQSHRDYLYRRIELGIRGEQLRAAAVHPSHGAERAPGESCLMRPSSERKELVPTAGGV